MNKVEKTPLRKSLKYTGYVILLFVIVQLLSLGSVPAEMIFTKMALGIGGGIILVFPILLIFFYIKEKIIKKG